MSLTLTSRVPTKLKPRVDFDPEQFRKMLFTKGLRVRWSMASECPCKREGESDLVATSPLTDILRANASARSSTEEPRPDCATCNGNGYFYHSTQDIYALVTRGLENPQQFAAYGDYAKGMASFTFLPEHTPSGFDKLVLLDSTIVFRETRRKTADSTQAMRYPIATKSVDLASGKASVDVLHVEKAVISGDSHTTSSLVKNTDYAVTADGKIDWALGVAAGTAPSTGTFFSVSYFAHPHFVVVDIPHSFRDTIVATKLPAPVFYQLPTQATAQLDFLNSLTGE